MPTKNRSVASTFGAAGGTAAQAQPNMLQTFGVDPRSQEQILEERTRQRTLDALAENDQQRERYAGDHDIEDAGAALGVFVMNKFKKAQLSPQEQAGAAAKKRAEDMVKLKREGGGYGEEGSRDLNSQANDYQRILASELIKMGDPRGIEIYRDLREREQAEQKYKEEREMHGIDVSGKQLDQERTRQLIDVAQYDQERKEFLVKRGEFSEVFLQDSDDPNESMPAYIDDKGRAMVLGEDGELQQMYNMGEYTTLRPLAAKEAGKGGKAAPEWTPTEAKEMRALQRSLGQQMDLGITLRDAMHDVLNADGTINIMDGAGSLTAGATKLANNINAVYRTGQKWVGFKDADGKILPGKKLDGSFGSSLSYLNDNPDIIITVPDSIQGQKNATARFKAAVVQMAYAKARSNEPGARQLSDHDFKNAVLQIGAAASDPEELRQVLVGDIARGVDNFNFWRAQAGEDRVKGMLDPDGGVMDKFDAKYEAFTDAFYGSWKAKGSDLKRKTTRGLGSIDSSMNADGTPAKGQAPAPTGTGTADDPIIL